LSSPTFAIALDFAQQQVSGNRLGSGGVFEPELAARFQTYCE
jgi:hypothetical protein